MARIGKEKREQIRKSIIEISKQLFLEKGYSNTSTKEIAKAVGIAEGTIFNYFKSKGQIFLEVFSENYSLAEVEFDQHNDIDGITDVLINFIEANMKKIMMLPKSVLKELGVTSLTLIKDKPNLMRKLIDLDFKFLEHMNQFISDLQNKSMIKECDASLLTEMIYSAAMFEFFLYVYEKDITKELFYEKVKEKIEFIIKPYV